MRLIGVVLMLVVAGPWLLGMPSPARAQTCQPAVLVTTSVLKRQRNEIVALTVTLKANATIADGDRLARVAFADATNAVLRANGVVQAVPSLVTLSPAPSSWSFVVQKVTRGRPFALDFVATDRCGDQPHTVGASGNLLLTSASSIPTPTATPGTVATSAPAPTKTAVPTATVAPTGTPTPTSPPVPTAVPTATPTATPTTPTGPVAPCDRSLQSLVDAAAPSAVVSVPACVFRETVTIGKPLTLAAQPGAEVRGSDVWTGWTRSGSTWIKGAVPAFQAHGECRPGGDGRCRRAEQVFFDGAPLTQVAAGPTSGQFAVDAARNVVLADDPNGHVVEVTTRARWVETRSDNVTIQGFAMRHAANRAQTGALSNDGYAGWTLRDNRLSDAHGALVSLNRGSGGRVLGNDISRGGQLGVHGSEHREGLIQGNTIRDSNTEDFEPGWEAGGLKLALATAVTLDGNEVYGNRGPGLWCDIRCGAITYSRNRVHHNAGAGIFFEISDGAKIHDNAVWENGWGFTTWGWGAGILVSSSANAEVYNNTVAWNGDGISVISQGRPEYPHVGNAVRDNLVIMDANQTGLGWYQDWAGVLYSPGSNNRGLNNGYWWPWAEDGRWRFEWQGGVSYLAAFSETPGEENGRYLSATEKDRALADRGMPAAPRPR